MSNTCGFCSKALMTSCVKGMLDIYCSAACHQSAEGEVISGGGFLKNPPRRESQVKFNEIARSMVDSFETAPDGINQHEPGAKLDAGKNRLGLVLGGFSRALQAVGQVGTFGANKYTDNGWMEVQNGEARYTDAMMRHQLKELAGEDVDPDSGMAHAAHTAWNALARLELQIRESEAKSNADQVEA